MMPHESVRGPLYDPIPDRDIHSPLDAPTPRSVTQAPQEELEDDWSDEYSVTDPGFERDGGLWLDKAPRVLVDAREVNPPVGPRAARTEEAGGRHLKALRAHARPPVTDEVDTTATSSWLTSLWRSLRRRARGPAPQDVPQDRHRR